MKNIRQYSGYIPQIDKTAFIDETAVIIGKIFVAENASIWCNAVLRGDVSSISIGKNTNIQDLTMLHVTHDNPGRTKESPMVIGDNVTVGHNCCLHSCTIENNSFIGMGSTIIDNAYIETNVMIGANSFVPQGKRLVSGYLYFGNPVKQIRPLTSEEIEHIQYSADHYVRIANSHKREE